MIVESIHVVLKVKVGFVIFLAATRLSLDLVGMIDIFSPFPLFDAIKTSTYLRYGRLEDL